MGGVGDRSRRVRCRGSGGPRVGGRSRMGGSDPVMVGLDGPKGWKDLG